MTTAVPDSWDEFCRISIMRDGDETNGYAFEGYTEDISFESGDKDIDVVVTTSGGRIVKPTPMGMESITLKVYPIKTNLSAGGFAQLFHPQAIPATSGDDATEPIVVTNTKERIKHAVVLLWSTRLPATATAVPGEGEPAYRLQYINAYMTSYKLDYSDKVLSAEVTFKIAPFNQAGTGNKREESTDGTTVLSAATTSATSWA